ncbi:hypothetical protein SAMN04488579_10547 [Eubacterium barkeri]|uniref:Uncharacterized protein n=1 Tax=Eubacterium barkeri TaxID=1528 RepID=A0A1H3DL31_EUBBA|nr:hypothetical protein SAMN04488579_10547 [Eubacterium barkeri]
MKAGVGDKIYPCQHPENLLYYTQSKRPTEEAWL